MKKLAIVAALVALAAGPAQPAGQELVWTAEYDEGIGTAVFEGVTLDQAWSAATKALLKHKYKMETAEKVSGALSASRQELASYHHTLNLFFETEGPGVKITASCTPLKRGEGLEGLIMKSGRKKEHEKAERKFFGWLAEELAPAGA